jgi:hypothetical protein
MYYYTYYILYLLYSTRKREVEVGWRNLTWNLIFLLSFFPTIEH